MKPPARIYDYETDGAAIYRASFATIREETDLTGLPRNAETVAVSNEASIPRTKS